MPLLLHAVSDNVHISAAAIAMKRVLDFFTVTFINTSHFVLLGESKNILAVIFPDNCPVRVFL